MLNAHVHRQSEKGALLKYCTELGVTNHVSIERF